MPQPEARLIRIDERDNVAVVANDGGLAAGTAVAGIVLAECVPQAHKVALAALPEGTAVRRYGVVIGHTITDIAAGGWVNEHNTRMPEAPGLVGLPMATAPAPEVAPLTGYTFEGFRNADGTVGTRNILGITTTVQCVAGVVDHTVARIKAELLPKYPNVDDVVTLEHVYGCGMAVDAAEAQIPMDTVRNIARNPNFAGSTMVVSLGCEKMQPSRLFPELFGADAAPELAEEDLVTLQDERHGGFEAMVSHIMETAERHLGELDRRRRETCPASDLVVGLQCGGSDALSGITANPSVGFAADLLVRAGATVMFAEVTEVRDGIGELTARAATPEIAAELTHHMGWYDAYLARSDVDRSANTTPGNKKGGLSNIVEKAMGSIIKSGTMPIAGVVPPGQQARQKGLLFAVTPASDFVCGTLQLAAGTNVQIFTTGRGTPYGLAEVPVIKVATRTDLARRWFDLMDVDAGRIVSAGLTIEDVGWELFRLILKVASGDKTAAEKLRLCNSLALFNPGPVT
ncbi:MAG: galactarate dehydratase [Acuticoccus sp.]